MEWTRHDYDAEKTLRIFTFICLFFLIAFFAFRSYELAAVLAFIGAVIVLQRLYARKVGNALVFHNNAERSRLVAGVEGAWVLTFSNKGLPIWGGRLKITFHDAVIPVTEGEALHGGFQEVEMPISISAKQQLTIKVPVHASHRGLARITKLEIMVPHLFGEEQIVLEYNPMIRQEQLVYPKQGNEPFRMIAAPQKPGVSDVRHSLFTDAFQPVGTRDYVSGDQFAHIHWKASARSGVYQTKLFSTVADESRLFCLDVTVGRGITIGLEERVEQLAGLVTECYKKQIPFAVAINIRSAGKVPFLYIPSGEGTQHHQRTMELLAVLPRSAATMPIEAMLAFLDSHMELPASVYFLSDQSQDDSVFVKKWGRRVPLFALDKPKGREFA